VQLTAASIASELFDAAHHMSHRLAMAEEGLRGRLVGNGLGPPREGLHIWLSHRLRHVP
jgi:hypothetical protein